MISKDLNAQFRWASCLWIVFVMAIQTAVGTAQDSNTIGDAAEAGPKKGIARLRGVVHNQEGAPLVGATVRIAIPETDMRFVDAMSGHKMVEAVTNANGVCFIEVPDLEKPVKASLDALMPGYQRLVGTLMMGGERQSVELVANKIVTSKMVLQPALYFKGVVVDEAGKPVPNVGVSANATIGNGAGGVESTTTKADGSFELFNYSLEPIAGGRGVVYFQHKDYVDNKIDDVYKIEEDDRNSVQITLAAGQKIAGTLLDVDGKPAAGRLVKVIVDGGVGRKAMMTNDEGKFSLRGLPEGELVLNCLDVKNNQKISFPIKNVADPTNLRVQLEPIDPPKMKKYSVLGMTLVDVDDDVQRAYALQPDGGALILDPGAESDRLKIGKLETGFHFWMACEQRIGSVREFVETVLDEAKNQTNAEIRVRVVYSFSAVEFDGTNTQYLNLTKEDVAGLQKLLDEIGKE